MNNKYTCVLLLFVATVALCSALNTENFTFNTQDVNATRGQFPYYALLILYSESVIRGACGGTLISNEYVLTAAHCISNADVEVHLGAHNLTKYHERGRVKIHYNSTLTLVHKLYIPFVAINDIGLVMLMTPVKFSKFIKPARLPFGCQFSVAVNVNGIGFGLKNTIGPIPEILQYANLTTISNQQCSRTYPSVFFRPGVVCAVGAEKEATCQADPGGPLVLRSTNILVGINSFNHADGCYMGLPSGFTRVQHHLNWITTHTNVIPTEPEECSSNLLR